MAEAKMTITQADESWQHLLSSKGMVLGRSPEADIILESQRVSRKHALIFQDPFGRWIIEDLDSRNGVLINGERIGAQAVLPGDAIDIGPFRLELLQPHDQTIMPKPISSPTTILAESKQEEEVVSENYTSQTLSGHHLEQLNKIIDRLSGLTDPALLYPELCRCLAQPRSARAVVIRLPESSQPLPQHTEVLAFHTGDDSENNAAGDTGSLYLSRRVLEAVRNQHTVISTNKLTLVDEQKPRAVISAPLSDPAGTLDALYLDFPLADSRSDLFEFIRAVSRQVNLIRKSLLLMAAKAERSVLEHQLSLARDIQRSLAPTLPDNLPGVDLAVHYQPALWVGGDYCDVLPLEDGRVAFAVGDVAGKGLPAAMVMSNLQAAFRTTISFCLDPAEVMNHINRHLRQNLPTSMFVTMFLGLFDPSSGKLEYVNAGHLQPLLVHPETSALFIGRPDDPILGVFDDSFHTQVETIPPTSALVVFTDGITEARSPDGVEFGSQRALELFEKAEISSAGSLIDAVTETVTKFRQHLPQQDDITLLALVNRGSGDND
ncbi:SpoIIE family protein phosphatase [Planctomycetota bacterium]